MKDFEFAYFAADVKRFRCYSYIAKRGLFFAHITKVIKKILSGMD